MAEKTKALASEQNDAVRALAQKLVKDDFGDNKSAAARAFNVSQSMLYEFLATPPRRGADSRRTTACAPRGNSRRGTN